MGSSKLFFFFIVSLLLIENGYSFGIGLTENIDKIEFVPNLERDITFVVYHDGFQYQPNIKGEFGKYVTFTEPVKIDDQKDYFIAQLRFPAMVEQRGQNKISIGISQIVPPGAGIAVSSNVRKAIYINVPYLGKYLVLSLSIPNANIDETISISLNANNLGEENVSKASAVIEIFDVKNQSVKKFNIEEKMIESRKSTSFDVLFNTTGHKAGNYRGTATLNWDGNTSVIETAFKIGTLNVKVINYTSEVYKGEINRFNITAESGWNSRISNIFAEVKVKDDGKEVASFLTPSIALNPWEIKNLEGYLDARNLEAKEYDIEINLDYEGSATTENGKVMVITEKSGFFSQNKLWITIAAVSIILVILNILVIFFLLKKKKGDEGQKKKFL